MTRWLLLSFLLITSAAAFSQRTEKVTATYTYHVPDNVALQEAKRTALDRAKISAIADAFGTLVSQSNSTVITNQNGQTDSHFLSIGGSEVRGEWIETIKEPIYTIDYEGNMLVVSVEVTGRIREIANAGIDVTAKILRNGTEEKFESQEFRNGDEMYLYFKSPVDGFLTVYLLDESTQDVFCLLPYRSSSDGAYCIEHDKPYILFSAKHETKNPNMVDEYSMTCAHDSEYNDIYVVFSPNSFTKANVSETMDDALPRQISYPDFKKWLVKSRNKDQNLIVINKQITIKN